MHTDHRQDPATWRAFHRLRLPPGDLEFLFIALWKKVAVGKRLHSIFPHIPDTCPFCGSVEDMHHRTKACAWLVTPVRVLNNTFPAVQLATGRAPISRLCSDYPTLSLTRALDLLLWKYVRVLWQFRCMEQFRNERTNQSAYIRMLHSETAKWLEMPELSVTHQAVHLFLTGLQGWLQDREFLVLPGSATAAQKRSAPCVGAAPDPHMYRPFRWDKAGRNRERQSARDQEGRGDVPQHVPEGFIDGSYAERARGVGFAGCGVWFGPLDPKNMSSYLPGMDQTNNRAELSASTAALHAVPAAQPLCVVTDSRYVHDGATTQLPHWLLLG